MIRRNEYEVNVCVRYTRFVLLCSKKQLRHTERKKAEKVDFARRYTLSRTEKRFCRKITHRTKVIELLNGIKNEILCVRGNCDTEVDQMVLEFPVLADYAVIFVDGKTLYLTHGHKYNPNNLPPIKRRLSCERSYISWRMRIWAILHT